MVEGVRVEVGGGIDVSYGCPVMASQFADWECDYP